MARDPSQQPRMPPASSSLALGGLKVEAWVQAHVRLVFLDLSSNKSWGFILDRIHSKCLPTNKSKLSVFIPSEPWTVISASSSFLTIAAVKLHKHRCHYGEEQEHLPLAFFSALPLHSWHSCELPASFPQPFFPGRGCTTTPEPSVAVMNEPLPAGERQTSLNSPLLLRAPSSTASPIYRQEQSN